MLERLSSISVQPLQTMFDAVMSTFPEEEVLIKEKIQKLWFPIINGGVDSLDEEYRDAATARYSTTKELFLEYMESDSRRVRRAKKGGAGRMDCMDWRTAESVRQEERKGLDSEFRGSVTDNEKRLLATVRS